MAKGRDPGKTWRYLVRATGSAPLISDHTMRLHEMKRLDHCELLGTATVDQGHAVRRPWFVMFSRVCPPTVSMWNRRGFEVAMLRMSLPAGNSEQGPVVWHARLGDAWYRVDFSTIQREGS